MADPRFLLDSNICIYASKGLGKALRARMSEQDEGSLAMSAITLAEIERGYVTAEEREALQSLVTAVPVLPFDEAAARIVTSVPLKRGACDGLIAAHALSRDLTLVTNNDRDFAGIDGLRIENWTR